MSDKTINEPEETFPGWNPPRNLRDLVRLIEPAPRLEPHSKIQTEKPTGIHGGPLLAGRGLKVQLQAAGAMADASSFSETAPVTTAQMPVTSKATKRSRGVPLKLAIGAAVLVGLLIFAWVVMKSSDYSGLDTIRGERFESDQVAVELGETVPSFSGLLLVDNPDEWGDTFSDQDLVGKNTVMFVWGSWNEELASWSQDLNYIRLVNFEGKDIQYLGLNLDKSKDDALAALNADLNKWPHLFNADERKPDEERPMFRLGVRSSPLILLIDATGRLRAEGLEPSEVVDSYQELFE